ncbi:MAG TPA: SLBB domain-containing protein [Bacteroidota bacterium]|nr:SLBB domain-containing protein [Bacteroidota bacterium]
MTPDEINQKLKDLGITRDEAIQRAKALNINLDDYLSRIPTPATVAPSSLQQDTTGSFAPARRRAEVLVAKKELVVPGFERRTGTERLQPFGYDIFQYAPSSFEPVINVSTPQSYVLGPGDQIIISVWGETRLNLQLTVNRDGNILVPDVGPVSANGVSVQQFREKLLHRMSEVYSGLKNGSEGANTFLDVSIGRLRTIQVYVMGEVVQPGGYSLSSMSTAFHALYVSGGPTVNGTMRDVQVIRDGKAIASVDMYNYVLRGDKSKDIRLQDDDIVFVKPAAKRVALMGEVTHPAIFEMRDKESLGNLIAMAGGLRFDAYFNRVHVERIIPFEQRHLYERNILDLDLAFGSLADLQKSSSALEDGDVVTIFKVANLAENRVSITGTVNKPGNFQLWAGMRIKDLIYEADSLQRNSFAERASLFRMLPDSQRKIISFNPRLALAADSENNIELQNEDSLVVYKETQFYPRDSVTIAGGVRNPGKYPRRDNMSVSDLLLIAGGLKEDAQTFGIQVSRLDTAIVGTYSKVIIVDLPKDYWNTPEAKNFYLKDKDIVSVPINPRFSEQKVVHLSGYALYPGTYALRYEGERLSEILKRAGGLRAGAYLNGSVLLRKARNATALFSNLSTDTAGVKINNFDLVPIDFNNAVTDTASRDNVVMDPDDSVHIAFLEDVVYVRGEVFVPTPILYKKGASESYYIDQAGGFKDDADKGKVAVFLPGGKKWEPGFFVFPSPEILPGSLVYVPRKIETEDKTLSILAAWGTVMASLAAITIAIVQVTK